MKEINNYIKENDTDNVIVSRIDKIIYDIVDNDYKYESYYGNSETMVEALGKLREVINYNLLDKINEEELTWLELTLRVNNNPISIYGSRTKKNSSDYNVLIIGDMNFEKSNITSSSVKNGEIEIGTIGMSGYPDKKVYGVLNGVCTINGVKQMCALRVDENVSGETAKVYLLLNDTTILTSTAQTLSVEASGTLKHNCNY